MRRKHPDTELKQMMVELLETQIGFEINLFDCLSVMQMEDLRFAVYHQPDMTKTLYEGTETLFESAEEAVDLFLKIRYEGAWGFDHETGVWDTKNEIGGEG